MKCFKTAVGKLQLENVSVRKNNHIYRQYYLHISKQYLEIVLLLFFKDFFVCWDFCCWGGFLVFSCCFFGVFFNKAVANVMFSKVFKARMYVVLKELIPNDGRQGPDRKQEFMLSRNVSVSRGWVFSPLFMKANHCQWERKRINWNTQIQNGSINHRNHHINICQS